MRDPHRGTSAGAGPRSASLLVVEDEQHIALGLRFNLQADGHQVTLVESGEEALAALEGGAFDLVLLDLMLPGISGFEVVEQMRRHGDRTPVLILTARGRSEDIVQGLTLGADDYLPKPFELAVLLARVSGLLRRTQWARAEVQLAKEASGERHGGLPVCYEFAGKVILFDDLKILEGEREIPLTIMEANLLRYLIEREGRPVSRKSLLEDVWGLHEDTDTRAVDNFIVRLRRYLELDPQEPRYLITVRGVGYKFERGEEAKPGSTRG